MMFASRVPPRISDVRISPSGPVTPSSALPRPAGAVPGPLTYAPTWPPSAEPSVLNAQFGFAAFTTVVDVVSLTASVEMRAIARYPARHPKDGVARPTLVSIRRVSMTALSQ